MAGNSPLHFTSAARRAQPAAQLQPTPQACLMPHFCCAGGGAGLACCQVGLDRPLLPAAFVANWFRSARVFRPRRSADRGSSGDAPPEQKWGHSQIDN